MTMPALPESQRPAAGMSGTVLITGAATGIGALAARSLASRGHTVYASMRDPDGADAERVAALRKGADGEMRTLELDVLEYLVGPFMHRGAECPAAAAQRRSRCWLTSRPA
jgi:NAD(P)-dependent dehydrogenase (short-subunit alcohol dehydrogenase family)